LADALRLLIIDSKRRERYGVAGKKLAIEKFGLDAVIDQTLKIYRDLLS
jgi:glycosyltransferase involved in cell wall biosynthesis